MARASGSVSEILPIRCGVHLASMALNACICARSAAILSFRRTDLAGVSSPS